MNILTMITVWAEGEEPKNNYPLKEGAVTLTQLLDNAQAINPLPYTDNGILDKNGACVAGDGTFGYKGGYLYAAAYKLTLEDAGVLKVRFKKINYPYLYLYKKDVSGNYVYVGKEEPPHYTIDPLEFNLTAGEYYLIGAGETNYPGAYLISCWIDGNEPDNAYPSIEGSLSLEELLDNHAKDINALPYVDSGTFYKNASIVADDRICFYDGLSAYAFAYKLDLQQGESINVNVSLYGSFVYLYEKNDFTGNYKSLHAISMMYGNLEYTVSKSKEYYLIGVTEFSVDQIEGDRSIDFFVWSSGDQPSVPSSVITSLQADKTIITFAKGTSDLDTQLLLGELAITATLSDNTTIEIINSPLGWTIASNGKSAEYLPVYPLDNVELGAGVKLTVFIEENETGVEAPDAWESIVYGLHHSILVKNAPLGSFISVYRIDGKLESSKYSHSDMETVNVSSSGIYIVRINDRAVKTFVK